MKKIFDVLNVIKQKLFVKKDKIHSEKYYRRIDFLNKYSLFIPCNHSYGYRIYSGDYLAQEFYLCM